MVAANFDDVVQALEAGLDSEIRSGGAGLSGGEQQRLRLFRSLIADPEVLVLIEPTSALDATTETQVVRRLRGYREGRTTVLFGNSPLMLHESDHVCWVADGVIVAEGRHEDLLSSVPDYRTLVARREVLA
jgi:ABC-type bacteriocin/lantibiotic exporter with double-glycine peptidase domain